ncbi:hypothetical protein BGZ73_003202 [Actinomortierella ambigua]|nr:hypothetical protein BGZ73_003202 [Actinomortierella ambigua]
MPTPSKSKQSASSTPSATSSMVVQPLSARNASPVSSLIFDSHMALVPKTFQFNKLKPLVGIFLVVIATAVYRIRGTSKYDIVEVLTILSGSIIAAQIILFLVILYHASQDAPTVEAVGGLARFELLEEKEMAAMGNAKDGDKKDAPTTKAPGTIIPGKDNQFWVLEVNEVVIGCIGAIVDKSKGTATLVHWAVDGKQQRKGAGDFLLRRAMDDLAKDRSIERVNVCLKGEQIPALRLFFRYGFDQVERNDWYLGEKVSLSITTKQWTTNKQKYDVDKPKTPL